MSDVRNILNALDAISENTVPKPSREGWWADENHTSIGLQVYNQPTYRGKHPFVVVDKDGQVTRIWLPTAKGQEEIKAEHPDAVIYASGTEANPQPQNTASKTASKIDKNIVPPADYKDNLANFVASDEKGLANNPEATGAITELNTRLSTLGFSEVASSTVYDIKTVNTVKALQQAYNNMYGEQRIKVDGDLGPRTFKVLTSVEDLLKKFNIQTATTESFKSEIARNIINEEVKQITGNVAGELTQTLVALDKFYQSATTNGLTISPDLQQRLINARLSLATHTIDVSTEITPYISTISKGAVERSKEQTATADGGGKITTTDPDDTKVTRDLDAIDAEREKQANKGITDPDDRKAAGLDKANVVEPEVVEPEVVEPEVVEPEVFTFKGGDEITAMQSDMIVLLSAWSGDQNLFEAKVKEFIELYEESINKNGDDRVRIQAEGLMRRLIQILIGNSRVPDTVQNDNAGKILIRKDKIDRSTIKLIRDFRTSLGRPKPEPETTEETNVFNTKIANKWPVVFTITDDNTIDMNMFDGKHQFKNVEFFPPRMFKGSDDRPGKDGTQTYGSQDPNASNYLDSTWDEFFETLANVDKLVKERTN